MAGTRWKVKALVTKPDSLRPGPRTHHIERQCLLLQLPSDLCVHAMARTHAQSEKL